MGRSLIAASTVAVLGLLAACGDDDDASTATTDASVTSEEQETTSSTSTTSQAPDDGAGSDDGSDTSADGIVRAEDGNLSDGVWAVGEAGTVEFTVADEGLTLVEVVEADGWTSRVEVDGREEIEVDFRRDGEEIDIEVEYDDGVLEVEIHHDIDGAAPGPFALGPAGTATLAVSGDDVSLADLAVTDGWSVTEQDTDDGEVEIDIRRDNVTWELDAEIDDGHLEVDTHFEIEGRYP